MEHNVDGISSNSYNKSLNFKKRPILDLNPKELSDILITRNSNIRKIIKYSSLKNNSLQGKLSLMTKIGFQSIIKTILSTKSIKLFSKVDIKDSIEYIEYFDSLNKTCEQLGVKVNLLAIDGNMYKYLGNTNKLGGCSHYKSRSIFFTGNSELVNPHIFFHEIGHHICEMIQVKGEVYSGYNGLLGGGEFINEGFNELFTYKCLSNYLYESVGLPTKQIESHIGYPHIVFLLVKLLTKISEVLNISFNELYLHVMKGYLIKGYKGLDSIYHIMGKDFLKEILELKANENGELLLLDILKKYYKKLNFKSAEEVDNYFNLKNKPGKEIENIVGIKR